MRTWAKPPARKKRQRWRGSGESGRRGSTVSGPDAITPSRDRCSINDWNTKEIGFSSLPPPARHIQGIFRIILRLFSLFRSLSCPNPNRSEAHTLNSITNQPLVCRLLLEKNNSPSYAIHLTTSVIKQPRT